MILKHINHHLITKMALISMPTRSSSKLKRKVSVRRVNWSISISGRAKRNMTIDIPLMATNWPPPSSSMTKRDKSEELEEKLLLRIQMEEMLPKKLKSFTLFTMISLSTLLWKTISSIFIQTLGRKKTFRNCSTISRRYQDRKELPGHKSLWMLPRSQPSLKRSLTLWKSSSLYLQPREMTFLPGSSMKCALTF